MFKSYLYLIFNLLFFIGIGSVTLAQTNKSHTVTAGETLYGIARNYQIHISELLKVNPQIENNYIKPGDVVFIPSKNGTTVVSPANTNPTPAPAQNKVSANQPFGGATGTVEPVRQVAPTNTVVPSVKNNQLPMIEHVVQEKQTLYAISKLYNVSVDEIRAWNHLADNSIKVGSVLYIRSSKPSKNVAAPVVQPAPATAPVVTPPAKVDTPAVPKVLPKVVETKPVETKPVAPVLPAPVKEAPAARSNSPQNQLEDAYVSAKNSGKTLQSSRGTITWIATENAKMSDSFFALHKTAPVGTIVKITNLVNKRVVFVKVIGKLPETSDNLNITLRLSSAAKNALLLNGDKAYVDMDFFQ